jgi:thymidylate kinase
MSVAAEEYRRALGSLRLPGFATPGPGRPFVVAIEGPNGAGKTTLCHALSERLNAPCCLGTDEAWFTENFKVRMIRDADWYASAMFFLSGCFEQMRLISDRSEPLVIMDRCLWSTLAVHAAESIERLKALLAMLKPIASEIQIPQFTVILEATFQTCQSRIARKPAAARALDELTARTEFHAREQVFYRWLMEQEPEVELVDVNEVGPEEVANKVQAILRRHPC